MSDVFYDEYLKIYKASQIPILHPESFQRQHATRKNRTPNYYSQLKTIISRIAWDIYKESLYSGTNGISKVSGVLITKALQSKAIGPPRRSISNEKALTPRYIKSHTSILFKQETLLDKQQNSYVLSYILVKFPRELNLKRQIIVFAQSTDNSDRKPFDTLILLRTSVPKLTHTFLKWCELKLGASVMLQPWLPTQEFLLRTVDLVFNHHFSSNIAGSSLEDALQRLQRFGDLVIEFNILTKLNALSSTKIHVANEDLKQYVHSIIKRKQNKQNDDGGDGGDDDDTDVFGFIDITDILFSHFYASTTIDFRSLRISKLRISNNLIFSMDSAGAKIQFYSGGLDISRSSSHSKTSKFPLNISDYIFEIYKTL
ncbi:hypothetical protein DASC09_010540 [Saccharomycopsis crataegensis]|uniref:Uncharacterized protein n=1 Tax=Saccharomycopsis crataegensis TaxID=43959 RepID=A0AAV5QG79_9ASCO|nr:hypothetical protein DASC09_010540 [Saccharomycopsis crataegensis]